MPEVKLYYKFQIKSVFGLAIQTFPWLPWMKDTTLYLSPWDLGPFLPRLKTSCVIRIITSLAGVGVITSDFVRLNSNLQPPGQFGVKLRFPGTSFFTIVVAPRRSYATSKSLCGYRITLKSDQNIEFFFRSKLIQK